MQGDAEVASPLVALLVAPLLSVREAAARLGVCTALVYRVCASGELPHVRVSSAIRIAEADLVAFIARRGGGAGREG